EGSGVRCEQLAEFLQSLADIHGVADDRIVDAIECADVADNDGASVYADANAKSGSIFARPLPIVVLQLLADGYGSADGCGGMALETVRRTEECQHAVAQKLVDRASMRVDRAAEDRKV